MGPVLSILIPHLPSRAELLDRLLEVLGPQVDRPDVELIIDGEQGITGDKRNRMVRRAAGSYIAHVDDDDMVSDDYVESILQAATQGADVICFEMLRFVDGELIGHQWFNLAHKSRYIDRQAKPLAYYYPPSHLCPVKAEIAKATPFPSRVRTEDLPYVRELQGKLASQAVIDKVLYHYLYRSNRPAERMAA